MEYKVEGWQKKTWNTPRNIIWNMFQNNHEGDTSAELCSVHSLQVLTKNGRLA